MAKGHNCPLCGENTFHENGRTRVCSNDSCNAEGWLDGEPGMLGAGTGKACGHCDERRLREMITLGKMIIYYCYGCGSVAARKN